MKKVALCVSILGLLILIIYIFFSSPIMINSEKDVESLIENQKVSVSGYVTQEKPSGTSRVLILNNNLSLSCECKGVPKLTNKQIEAIGVVDTYQKTKIIVKNIKWR